MILASHFHKGEIGKLIKQATPVEWDQYMIVPTVIKLYNFYDANIGPSLRD